MQKSSISDKDILYSMIEREVENILGGVPIFSAFSRTASSFIIQLVDPYVSAFVGDDNTIDSEQLSSFASEEALSKINEFKKRYNSAKGSSYENKNNF